MEYFLLWYGLVMRNPVLKCKSLILLNYKLQMIIKKKKCVALYY